MASPALSDINHIKVFGDGKCSVVERHLLRAVATKVSVPAELSILSRVATSTASSRFSNDPVAALSVLMLLLTATDRADATIAASDDSFSNPVLPSGPDPCVVAHDGGCYYTHTLGDRIGVANCWTPPVDGSNSHSI